MISRAKKGGRHLPKPIPSPAEITERTAAIRATWSSDVERSRRGLSLGDDRWTPPTIDFVASPEAMADLRTESASVYCTSSSLADFLVQAVASSSCRTEQPLGAAVEDTDRS